MGVGGHRREYSIGSSVNRGAGADAPFARAGLADGAAAALLDGQRARQRRAALQRPPARPAEWQRSSQTRHQRPASAHVAQRRGGGESDQPIAAYGLEQVDIVGVHRFEAVLEGVDEDAAGIHGRRVYRVCSELPGSAMVITLVVATWLGVV